METETETELPCPYCGKLTELTIDDLGGKAQRYVEDCTVCCRPIDVDVHVADTGEVTIALLRNDD